jgi:uncharacterized protein YkwD
MLRFVVLLAVSLALCGPVNASSDTCVRAALHGPASQNIAPLNLDQDLFEATFLLETNFHRCMADLPGLAQSNMLGDVALGHTRWMAGASILAHESLKPGNTTLKDRLGENVTALNRATENVGRIGRFQAVHGERFEILSLEQCRFRRLSGQIIPPHTFATLARHLAQALLNSPGHRENMLDPLVDAHGAAIAFDPTGPFCGNLFITQNFGSLKKR